MKGKRPIQKSYIASLSLKHIFGLLLMPLTLLVVTPAHAEKTLIYGIENEIKDFNISRSLDKNAFALAEIVTEGLFWQKPSGELVPDLLLKSEYLGKTWKLWLRKSKFSNGKVLACSDVRANIEEARNSKRPIRNRLKDISATECQGEVLLLHTYRNSGQLLKKLGAIIRVYDHATLQERNPVGSGPYFVADQKGKDLILRRNPFYQGRQAPYDKIVYRALRDPWLRDLALLSGNVDFLLENFSRNRVLAFEKKSESLRLFQTPTPLLFYIGLNLKRFTLLQRKRILNDLMSSQKVESYWGDQVQRAQKIFGSSRNWPAEEEKFPTSELKLEVSCAADESQLQFLKVLAQELKPKGIRLTLKPFEFATFMSTLNKKAFDSYLFYIDTSHVQNLEALLSSTGGRLGLENSQIDALFSEIQSLSPSFNLDPSKEKLEGLARSEAVLLPLFWAKKHFVILRNSWLGRQFNMTDRGFWKDLLEPL